MTTINEPDPKVTQQTRGLEELISTLESAERVIADLRHKAQTWASDHEQQDSVTKRAVLEELDKWVIAATGLRTDFTKLWGTTEDGIDTISRQPTEHRERRLQPEPQPFPTYEQPDITTRIRRQYMEGTTIWNSLGDKITSMVIRDLLSYYNSLITALTGTTQLAGMMHSEWDFDGMLAEEFFHFETDAIGKENPLWYGQYPQDKEMLQLKHYLSLSQREIADHLGISQAAASNRMTRALNRIAVLVGIKKLRQMASKDGYTATEASSVDAILRGRGAWSPMLTVQLLPTLQLGLELYVATTDYNEPPSVDDAWYKRAVTQGNSLAPGSNVPMATSHTGPIPTLAIYRRKTGDVFLCQPYRLANYLEEARMTSRRLPSPTLDQIFNDIPRDFRSFDQELRNLPSNRY